MPKSAEISRSDAMTAPLPPQYMIPHVDMMSLPSLLTHPFWSLSSYQGWNAGDRSAPKSSPFILLHFTTLPFLSKCGPQLSWQISSSISPMGHSSSILPIMVREEGIRLGSSSEVWHWRYDCFGVVISRCCDVACSDLMDALNSAKMRFALLSVACNVVPSWFNEA